MDFAREKTKAGENSGSCGDPRDFGAAGGSGSGDPVAMVGVVVPAVQPPRRNAPRNRVPHPLAPLGTCSASIPPTTQMRGVGGNRGEIGDR